MNDMKKYIYLLAISAFAIFGCVPTSQNEDTTFEYAGNKVKVTIPSDPIPADGGSLRVVVNNAKDLTYDISLPETASWLSMARQDSVLTFTAQPNSSTDHRYASIGVIDTEKKIAITRFDVMQDGVADDTPPVINYRFNVSPTEFSVNALDEKVVFNVSAENVEWTAVSDNPDFKLSLSSGNTNAQITVSFPANTDTEAEKKAVITVSTTSENVLEKSFAVAITQAKAEKTDGKPVKPAPGVLAEWHFHIDNLNALAAHFDEAVTDELADSEGFGGLYVEPNVRGKGRLQWYNQDKKGIVDKEHKRCKRAVGQYGEPCVYGPYVGDYALWTAEADAPLAAGTKLHIIFTVRPNTDAMPKYWMFEYLDGTTWKPALEVKKIGDVDYTTEFFFAAGSGNQVNTNVEATVTLTAESTESAQFRLTCVSNLEVVDGVTPLTLINKSIVFRFAGESCNESTPHYSVTQHPLIEVVE